MTRTSQFLQEISCVLNSQAAMPCVCSHKLHYTRRSTQLLKQGHCVERLHVPRYFPSRQMLVPM
ncbi:hypothetical protein COCON_G00133140 [Conger conger]|uniref:Uncharacterized protein n=1 Tax=Conger conger TaxID=82655 RepID=A0A9Q1DE99_CONCO|nr:hypothetical protein COCON_G00133140 [Conger conger]